MLSGDGISYSLIGVCTIYKGANNLGASVDAPQSVQIELFIKEYLFPSEYNRPLVLPFCKPKHIGTCFLVGITLIQMYCDGTITPENSAFFPNCEIKGKVLACIFSTPKRKATGSNPVWRAKKPRKQALFRGFSFQRLYYTSPIFTTQKRPEGKT